MSTDPTSGKTKRGGKRPGAGRKPKGHASPTAVHGVDLVSAMTAPIPDDIETVAQQHARTALANLVKQMTHGTSDAARIRAAETVLDRGYGKPSTEPGGDLLLPFLGNAPARELSTGIRDEARRHANLAIEVLRRIADASDKESARVMASKALLDRGLGLVAAARLQENTVRLDIGKKELAQQEAQDTATGRYATPAPPPGMTMQ